MDFDELRKAVESVVDCLREYADNNDPLTIKLLQMLDVEPYSSWPEQ